MYDLMKKVTLIALMTGLLHKKLTKCFTRESFRRSELVPSPRMSLFKLISLRNFVQSTSKLQPMHQSLFIQEFLLYKYLSDLSELEF